MSNIKLSICIPTRNRDRFIGESLDSIISQANDSIEIVIVDGASTDNTSEVVKQYQKKFPNILYSRGEKNMGVDRDMATTVELAHGDYCWLFTDDDLIKPGAIDRILKEIESGCEIYLTNTTVCTVNLKPYAERYWLSSKVKDRTFNLNKKNEMIEYCNLANSIGAFFSYTPSVILNRQAWNKTGYLNEFDRSAYAMAATLFSFFKRKCRLRYIRDSLVLWRGDNDSFQNEGGMVKRFLLDFDAYLKLADTYFSDDKEIKSAFLKIMTREHPWYTIVNVTSHIKDAETWIPFRAKMLRFGYSPGLIAVCYALGRLNFIIPLAVMAKRKIVKNPWLNKVFGVMISLKAKLTRT